MLKHEIIMWQPICMFFPHKFPSIRPHPIENNTKIHLIYFTLYKLSNFSFWHLKLYQKVSPVLPQQQQQLSVKRESKKYSQEQRSKHSFALRKTCGKDTRAEAGRTDFCGDQSQPFVALPFAKEPSSIRNIWPDNF